VLPQYICQRIGNTRGIIPNHRHTLHGESQACELLAQGVDVLVTDLAIEELIANDQQIG